MSDLAVPLSLQDICKIYVVSRFDEFPGGTLAFIPPKIRQNLLLLLPQADVLHFLADSDDNIVCSIDLSIEAKGMETKYRRELIESVLHDSYISLHKSVTLCLFSSRQALDYCNSDNPNIETLTDHISKWPCLQLRVIPGEYSKVVLPGRFFQYFPEGSSPDNISPEIQLSATQSLLDYCNLQTAPKQLMIDCSRIK